MFKIRIKLNTKKLKTWWPAMDKNKSYKDNSNTEQSKIDTDARFLTVPGNDEIREDGFYWVRQFMSGWKIALYDSCTNEWALSFFGTMDEESETLRDEDLQYIDEMKLTRENSGSCFTQIVMHRPIFNPGNIEEFKKQYECNFAPEKSMKDLRDRLQKYYDDVEHCDGDKQYAQRKWAEFRKWAIHFTDHEIMTAQNDLKKNDFRKQRW